MTLEFLKAADMRIWIVLILSLLAMLWHIFWHPRKGRLKFLLSLRLILFGVLIFLLFQPRLTTRKVIQIPRTWKIFLDNSLSMRYHRNVSLATLKAGINELVDELKTRGLSYEAWLFSHDLQAATLPMELTAEGMATDLGACLARIQEFDPATTAGIILISDGQPTHGADPVPAAEKCSIPIFTIGIGDTTPMVDVAVHSLDYQPVAVKGEDLVLTVTITSVGPVRDRVNVLLTDGTHPLGSRTLMVYGHGSRNDVRFQFKPQTPGKSAYEVSVSSLAEEINIQNNRRRFEVTVLRDRYPVALVTGSPNPNTPLIKDYLRKHPRVRLQHFIQIGNSFKPPLREFWENSFDLIVFDNFPTEPLGAQWQRIFGGKLLTHNSSIAWVPGPNITPESAPSLFPFFHITPYGNILDTRLAYPWYFTESFYDSPVAAQFRSGWGTLRSGQLPPLQPGLQVEPAGDHAQPLAYLSGPVALPLLVLGEKEKLRSLVWTSPDFSLLHYKLVGTPYAGLAAQLWEGILPWLLRSSGDREVYFRLNKDSYQQGEQILVTGTILAGNGDRAVNTRVTATIFDHEKKVASTELRYDREQSRWTGEMWSTQPGEYRYEVLIDRPGQITTHTGTFSVTQSQIELNKVFLNQQLLTRLAESTGGRYSHWNARHKLFDLLVQEETLTTETTVTRFGEETWMLILVIILLVLEWSWRRRLGFQ